MSEAATVSKYDRLYGGLRDVSLATKPSTVKNTESITGKSETFIVETLRHAELGDFVFIETMSEDGVIRLALPPKVAAAIASQKDALTKRGRSIRGKRVMRERMDAGWVPTFQKKSGKKK